MVLAVKRRCRNAVDRRSRRRNFDRRCEVNFIPLVTGVDVDDEQLSSGRVHGHRSSHSRRHTHQPLQVTCCFVEQRRYYKVFSSSSVVCKCFAVVYQLLYF